MSKVFLGTELKLNINIADVGTVTMDNYDFTVTAYCSSNKTVVIPKADAIRIDSSNYVLRLDTMAIGAGRLRCRVVAELPDGDFPDQLRTEVVVVDTGIEILKA